MNCDYGDGGSIKLLDYLYDRDEVSTLPTRFRIFLFLKLEF